MLTLLARFRSRPASNKIPFTRMVYLTGLQSSIEPAAVFQLPHSRDDQVERKERQGCTKSCGFSISGLSLAINAEARTSMIWSDFARTFCRDLTFSRTS